MARKREGRGIEKDKGREGGRGKERGREEKPKMRGWWQR